MGNSHGIGFSRKLCEYMERSCHSRCLMGINPEGSKRAKKGTKSLVNSKVLHLLSSLNEFESRWKV